MRHCSAIALNVSKIIHLRVYVLGIYVYKKIENTFCPYYFVLFFVFDIIIMYNSNKSFIFFSKIYNIYLIKYNVALNLIRTDLHSTTDIEILF